MRALAAVAVTAACAAPAADPVPVRDAPPVWQVRAAGGMHAIDPGPAADELLDARGCATCHAAIVDEWARSRHAVAWTNELFRHEYAAKPQPWCVNCHAPLTTQQRDLGGPRAAQGVDCASCHVRGGKLVGKRRAASSPHATIVDPSFGSPAFCADCHQFTFPILDDAGRAVRMSRHPMQDTVASFAGGSYAGEPDGCLACHRSPAGHAFRGAHDPGMLEAALDVAWCRADGALDVTVRNAGAGHAVPSGDVHRHLYLRVWRSSAPEAMYQAFFGRRFDPAPDGGKLTSWDSTLPPQRARHLAVPLAGLAGDDDEPLNLELVYVYIEDPPGRARKLAEPTTRSVIRRRAAPDELPSCAR